MIKKEIVEWVKNFKNWEKFLAKCALENKLYEHNLEKLYILFLQEYGIVEKNTEEDEINFEENYNSTDTEQQSDYILAEIFNINHVNALADNQTINIAKNLTVIYGENGSGKSGYIRFLNNVFNSRGEKDILDNIFNKNKGVPSGFLKFSNGKENIKLNYPEEKENPLFKTYSVFDNSCINIHLENENELFFTPNGFDFFDKFIVGLNYIESHLDSWASKHNYENEFIHLFEGKSEISDLIKSLRDNPDLIKISELSNVSEGNKKEYEQLLKNKKELLKADPENKIKELNQIIHFLRELEKKIVFYYDQLNKVAISKYKKLIEDYLQKESISKNLSVEQFETDKLIGVNSSEWNVFLKSAHDFAKLQNREDSNMYPKKEDICLFCRQSLNSEQIQLINNYWNYLTSTAKSDFDNFSIGIEKLIANFNSFDFNLLDNNSILYNWFKNEDKLDIIELVNQISVSLKFYFSKIIDNLKAKEWNEFNIELNSIEFISLQISGIDKKLDVLKDLNVSDKLGENESRITYLKHKFLLEKLKDKIVDYVSGNIAVDSITNSKRHLNSRKITTKQNELFNTHVIDKYVELFNKECDKLKANFGVEIYQRGQKGKTYRKLRIVDYVPKKVLSEGEQRAISIADFLTEIQLCEFNKGIIFDDPVNSFDNKRKELIAKRLIEESLNRQVVIFTHDLVFLFHLKNKMSESSDCLYHWIQKQENVSGLVFNNNSPAVENDYKTTKIANEIYNEAKSAPPEIQSKLLAQGFGALRTNYEAFVIFELFGGVINRFHERISMERLTNTLVPKDLQDRIIERNSVLSKYIDAHLHSDEYMSEKPDVKTFREEIDLFNKLKVELKSLKNTN